MPVACYISGWLPEVGLNLSPFEILYDKPFQLFHQMTRQGSVNALKYLAVANYVKSLDIIKTSVHEFCSIILTSDLEYRAQDHALSVPYRGALT